MRVHKSSEASRNIPWLHFRCGDRVHRIEDERHVGVIISITQSIIVYVRWEDNNWFEYVHANELQKVKK